MQYVCIVSVFTSFTESMMIVYNVQEKSDWIIYNRYVQRDLELCKLLIDQEMRNTKDNNEFVFYILVVLESNKLTLLVFIKYPWTQNVNCHDFHLPTS